MEKRAILAFGLSAVLLFTYMWVQEQYFPAAPPQRAEAPRDAPVTPTKPAEPVPAPPSPGPPTAAKPVPTPSATESAPTPRPPQRTAEVATPLYHAIVSSEGGKLQEWTLDYRGKKPVVQLGEFGPAGLLVGPADGKQLAPVPMTIEPQSVRLDTGAGGEIRLAGNDAGLEVREVLGFRSDSYAVTTRISLRNAGTTPRSVAVSLPWSSRQDWTGTAEKFAGQHPKEVSWQVGGHVDRIESLTGVPEQQLAGEWIALDTGYYVAALVPKAGGFKLVTRSEGGGPDQNAQAARVTIEARATPTIAPGQTWTGEVLVYIGPKEYERLKALGLEGTLNFGGFPLPRKWGGLPMEWIGVPILLLLKWVYNHVGNYGVAIIVLTVVSKILFYPLTVKSMKSMKAMQALQPQINALRTKHKSDPQRVQRETLDLYRRHKVNPAGGCLPMVAQIPVFYALYLALSVSVELQNAPFLCFGRLFGADLWICDLAAMDPTYVLPILMGVTMFVQQKMSPVMGDPRQAKMMLVMPFVFTIMFVNLPSGLVLYWTVSNVLQILQQWYMDRPRTKVAARELKDASDA
jgi:YidC/Oxa1 family membrane protein insertase